MKLIQRDAPHIRHSDSNKTVMGDVIITLLALYIIAVSFYGVRVLMVMVVSVLVCVLSDIVGVLLRRREVNYRDFSPIVTGLIIPLLMPATTDYTTIIAACVFAILIIKHPFGGLGENMFNPAAGGVAFAIVLQPTKMFAYPEPFANIPLFDISGVATVSGDAGALKYGGVPGESIGDMILGLTPGAMGASSILVIIACFVFLAYRRTVPFIQPLAFMAAVALVALIFPRANLPAGESIMRELFSGSLLFGGVFLLSDPVTSPKRFSARLCYGFAAGIVAMVFRHIGAFEQTVTFAVLLMNAVSTEFDRGAVWAGRYIAQRRMGNETEEE